MDELTGRIHALPPELFEMIYVFTFTAIPRTHHINKCYKPSALLAVDRASRDLFAASYYGQGSTFYYIRDPGPRDFALRDWLASLTPHHQRLLHNIRILQIKITKFQHTAEGAAAMRGLLLKLREVYGHIIERSAPNVRKEHLHIGLGFDDRSPVSWSDDPRIAAESEGD